MQVGKKANMHLAHGESFSHEQIYLEMHIATSIPVTQISSIK